MRIDSRKMPCYQVTFSGRETKVVKAPDLEAVGHWLRKSGRWGQVEQIPKSNGRDANNGADVVIDWSGKVLRTALANGEL